MFLFVHFNIIKPRFLMATKRNYNSNSLLEIKFKPNCKGYDCDQVDSVLDQIIIDYKNFEKSYAEAKEYISKLEKLVHDYQESSQTKDIEIARLTNRVNQIGENTNVTSENIDLLNRIRKLEQALYSKGVDPSKIK